MTTNIEIQSATAVFITRTDMFEYHVEVRSALIGNITVNIKAEFTLRNKAVGFVNGMGVVNYVYEELLD